jgi:hypothetical protein
MVRPTQRQDGQPRLMTHPVQFTSVEYGKLKRQAYNSGVSVAELIRSAALRREVTPPPPPVDLDDAFHRELKEIGRSLNSLAKKVNQTAKAGLALYLDADQVRSLLVSLSGVLGRIQGELKKRSPQGNPMEPHRHFKKSPKVHVRSIRLARDEYELLKHKAHQARTSVTRFLRQAALKLQVVEPPPPSECCWRIHAELSDIKNNLNQLNRAVNRCLEQGQRLSFPQELVEKLLQQIPGIGFQLLDATEEEWC